MIYYYVKETLEAWIRMTVKYFAMMWKFYVILFNKIIKFYSNTHSLIIWIIVGKIQELQKSAS